MILLILLSALTIVGTAVPTTIAASSYQKKETINSDINYQQTNNLENLNRTKGENNYKTPEAKVSYDMGDFFSFLYNIMDFLQNNDNTRLISPEATGGYSSQMVFYINENFNNQYFIMPININDNRRISLVFRSNDLYLQGFVGHPIENEYSLNVYYHFNNATIRNIPEITRRQELPISSSYTASGGLQASGELSITWTSIVNSFQELANYGENPTVVNDRIRNAFVRVILATSESMRFRAVRNNIIGNYNSTTETSNWGWYFNSFLSNWDHFSQDALKYLILFGTLIGFSQLNDISIFSKTLSNNFQSCNKGRSINSNNNEYCFVFPEKTIHWRDDKKSFEIINDWYSNKLSNAYIWSKEFNLGSTNPKNYNRIEFLGDTSNSRISWGNNSYYATGFNLIENSDFQHFLKNGNNNNGCDQGQLLVGGPVFILQNLQQKKGKSSINGDQWIAFCYYKNDSNYYLRVSVLQRVDNKNNSKNGALFLYIGRGLRLYNQ